MKKKREVKDKTKNNIFAAAVDHLKRIGIIRTQLELAERMHVNKDTISNILNYRTEVTDDAITKLQTASGCIFNLQWLRGESNTMLTEQTKNDSEKGTPIQNHSETLSPEVSSIINALISAHADTVASLKRELVNAEEAAQQQLADHAALVDTLRQQLADRAALIDALHQQIADLRSRLEKTDIYGYPVGAADDKRKQGKTP